MKNKIIISLDCDWNIAMDVVNETKDLDCVYGYKIGFRIGLLCGLLSSVDAIKLAAPTKKIIYDHQKAGNDIPEMGKHFARVMKKSNVDHAILFPFVGSVSLKSWVQEVQKEGIDVIVGGRMTHTGFTRMISTLESTNICCQAAKLGVKKFVLPPDDKSYYNIICEDIARYCDDPIFLSPGFGAQGCYINDYTDTPIIGRSIIHSKNIKAETLDWHNKLFSKY